MLKISFLLSLLFVCPSLQDNTIGIRRGDDRTCKAIAHNMERMKGQEIQIHPHDIVRWTQAAYCQEAACDRMIENWEPNIECMINYWFGTGKADGGCEGAGTTAFVCRRW